MTTPALMRLREALPQARITLTTPEKLADLWKGYPAVDAVLPFGPKDTLWKTARRLREGGYTASLVLPNSTRSALEVWLARIPKRVGYGGVDRRWFLTDILDRSPATVRMRKRTRREILRLIRNEGLASPALPGLGSHHIHQYLRLAAALGANPAPMRPLLTVERSELEAMEARVGFKSSGTIPWIGLNPGAEYGPAKRWPVERFVQLALELHRRQACLFLIFGGKADVVLAERIMAEIRAAQPPSSPSGKVVNLAGATTLRELCAGLALCRVVLTNDTGPMHVAAAVGTPVVVPFGSASPELTGPGLPGDTLHTFLRGNAPCAPCFLRQCPIDFRCMTGIQVNEVVEAVLRAMRQRRE